MIKVTVWSPRVMIDALSYVCPSCEEVNIHEHGINTCSKCNRIVPDVKKLSENEYARLGFFLTAGEIYNAKSRDTT